MGLTYGNTDRSIAGRAGAACHDSGDAPGNWRGAPPGTAAGRRAIDSGLCRLALPASLGGHEAEPVVPLQIYEELACGDASVAWIAWNNQLPLYGGAIHAAKTTDAVVTAIYEVAGTSALCVDCPLEGAHRDIRAVTQHTILWFMRLEDAGWVHLGLKPNNPLF